MGSHQRRNTEDVKYAFERVYSNSWGGGTVEPDVALKAQRHPVWQLVERFLDLSRKAGGIPWTAALPPLVLGHM